MRYLLLAALLLLVPPLVSAEEPCPLRGTWRSNAEKTLADTAARRTFTERQRARLSNHFFGRLVAEYTCTHGRTYFADGPVKGVWAAYQVTERGPQFAVVEYRAGNEPVKYRFEFEGECYKVFIERLGFYEYFCRTSASEG